jgi:hypothetical protein
MGNNQQQARSIWHLPWQLDPATAPAGVFADAGGLIVVIALTVPLMIRGSVTQTQALCGNDRYSILGVSEAVVYAHQDRRSSRLSGKRWHHDRLAPASRDSHR